MCLKINWSVKAPWHRPSMGVARSGLWAPVRVKLAYVAGSNTYQSEWYHVSWWHEYRIIVTNWLAVEIPGFAWNLVITLPYTVRIEITVSSDFLDVINLEADSDRGGFHFLLCVGFSCKRRPWTNSLVVAYFWARQYSEYHKLRAEGTSKAWWWIVYQCRSSVLLAIMLKVREAIKKYSVSYNCWFSVSRHSK